jgi:DNA-binding transcriptional LysR family regulator
MELFQVRYFLALSKTLNFTRAAEACNVTQPALASDSPFSSQCRVGK